MDLEEILLIIALIVGASIDVFIVLKLCSKYIKNLLTYIFYGDKIK